MAIVYMPKSVPITRLIIPDMAYVTAMPNTPEIPPIINVSALNSADTSRFLPPRLRMTPISLMRSMTYTYVIIAIITVETTSDNAVNAISALVTMLIMVFIIVITMARLSV